jgi:hypothetical protein
MRRKVIAITLALMFSIMIVFGVAFGTNRPAAAAVNDTVCPLPGVCVDVPTVTLPGVTVTRLVTLPPQTVRIPPVTVTKIINLPPVTRTIIVPGEAGTRTVTVGLPRATTTATVVVNKEIIRNGTAPPVTREVRSTVPGGQSTVTSATVVPSKEVVRLPGTTRTVTKLQAVGLSLLGLILLMGLGLFLLWLGFILGYKSSEKENTNFLRALRDSIRRPGKHE